MKPLVKIFLFISGLFAFQTEAVALPSSHQSGMNGVPVHDQSWEWGTCVTISVIDALNAHHGLKVDRQISPTCFIQMTRSLQSPEKEETWWDDGNGGLALLLLEHYGIWTLKDQRERRVNGKPACGGLREYPFRKGESEFRNSPELLDMQDYISMVKEQRARDGGFGKAMPLKLYEAHSRYLVTHKDWRLLLLNIEKNPEHSIQRIKKALVNGNRVIVSLNIDPFLRDHGKNLGALGNYRSLKDDTWILTPEIEQDIQQKRELSGHAVIITGYDDKACVNEQCGLFTIRHSVGKDLGDHGNFYASYDYFRKLASGSAFAVGPIPANR